MKTNFNRTMATTIMFVACLLFTTHAYAQSMNNKAPAEERAKNMTEKMKEKLSLTNAQSQSVYTINLKYANKNEQIMAGNDSKLSKLKKYKASQEEKSKELQSVLTKEQYTEYQKLANELKSELKENYKNRKK